MIKMQKPLDVETCERCGKRSTVCEDVKFHGYTMTLCRKCGLAALHSGEATD